MTVFSILGELILKSLLIVYDGFTSTFIALHFFKINTALKSE